MITRSPGATRSSSVMRSSRPRYPSTARSQVEQGFQADGQPGTAADAAHGQEDSGHERYAVERVVADGQRLTRRAEDDLLMGDHPGDPQRVDAHAVDVGAPRAVLRLRRGVRLVTQTRVPA